jgi:hypothetical protein
LEERTDPGAHKTPDPETGAGTNPRKSSKSGVFRKRAGVGEGRERRDSKSLHFTEKRYRSCFLPDNGQKEGLQSF